MAERSSFSILTVAAANERNSDGRDLSRLPGPYTESAGDRCSRQRWTGRRPRLSESGEESAYAIGAAALVPFSALRRAVLQVKAASEIASHFRVSRALVEYRLKVTRLWSLYKSAHS